MPYLQSPRLSYSSLDNAVERPLYNRTIAAVIEFSVDRPQVGKDGKVEANGHIQRFVFAQDTGGAIRGAGRLDFFCGAGEQAEHMAGAMQHKGRLFVLVPKVPANVAVK